MKNQENSSKRNQNIKDFFPVKSKRPKPDVDEEEDVEVLDPSKFEKSKVDWTILQENDLNIEYAIIFTNKECQNIFQCLEGEVSYFTGDLAKIKVFGKVHPIPRQQSAYGDEGVKYKYSGTTVPALAWTETLSKLREILENIIGVKYNFVLVNRYKDGNDKMGDHKDDEKELDPAVPIASLTFGAERDFIFKHQDRGKNGLENVKIILKDGMLLLMNHPTNQYWYHGLPPRKTCSQPRINLTFRKIINQ